MLIKGEAQQLADDMIKISNKYYYETWAMGLEFELWNEVLGNQDKLSKKEIIKLKDFSERCNGWIKMNYANDSLEFISIDKWKKIFREEKPF